MAKTLIKESGSITALNGTVTIDCRLSDNGAVGVQVTGTWSATHKIEAMRDGTNWVAIAFVDESTGDIVAGSTGFTANGLYRVEAVGYQSVRVKRSAHTSGEAVVTLTALEG